MATGQTILNLMELLNQELQLQAGEADVTRGLLALNVAQDYFESLAAARPKIGQSGTGTVVTADGVESSTFPADLLRLDRIQWLDDTTLRPKSELIPLKRAGGHAGYNSWPLNLFLPSGTGTPSAYWTDETNIYWAPVPAGVYTLRCYGLYSAADITASGTFSYKDLLMLPLASFACRLVKMGVDDPIQDVAGLAQETFKASLDALSNFNRDGATGLEYTQIHTE